MNRTITKVVFYYRGSFFDEESTKEVEDRDITNLEVPEGAYAFQFYDIELAKVMLDGELQEVAGKRRNQSPRFYPGAKIYMSESEIKSDFPDLDTSILASNVWGNGYKGAIRSRRGNWQTFSGTEVIL